MIRITPHRPYLASSWSTKKNRQRGGGENRKPMTAVSVVSSLTMAPKSTQVSFVPRRFGLRTSSFSRHVLSLWPAGWRHSFFFIQRSLLHTRSWIVIIIIIIIMKLLLTSAFLFSLVEGTYRSEIKVSERAAGARRT